MWISGAASEYEMPFDAYLSAATEVGGTWYYDWYEVESNGAGGFTQPSSGRAGTYAAGSGMIEMNNAAIAVPCYVKANVLGFVGTELLYECVAPATTGGTVTGAVTFAGPVTFTSTVTMSGSTDFVLPTSAPASPVTGSFYYSSSLGELLVYNGTAWVPYSSYAGTEPVNTVFSGPSSGGSAAAPTFRALVAADLPTVPVTKGGTGLTSSPANGQLLIGNGTGYTLADLTAGPGIAITKSGGSITITNDEVTFGTVAVGYFQAVSATSPTLTLADSTLYYDGTRTSCTSSLSLSTAGNGICVKEGSNCKQGTATLSGGSVTVVNSSITANSRIFAQRQTGTGTPGHWTITRTAGTSFTITSTSTTDNCVAAYEIFEPA